MLRKPLYLFCAIVIASFVTIPAITYQQRVIADDTMVVMTPAKASNASLTAFRKAIIVAAENAHKDGEITRGELLKIRILSTNHRALLQAYSVVSDQIVSEGTVASAAAIDWDSLATLLKEWLPVILELIKLFANDRRFIHSSLDYTLAA